VTITHVAVVLNGNHPKPFTILCKYVFKTVHELGVLHNNLKTCTTVTSALLQETRHSCAKQHNPVVTWCKGSQVITMHLKHLEMMSKVENFYWNFMLEQFLKKPVLWKSTILGVDHNKLFSVGALESKSKVQVHGDHIIDTLWCIIT